MIDIQRFFYEVNVMKSTFFGAAYYAEYMPYDRIDTDFQLMKDAGMNVIRIAESTWSTWEPSDNVFDFTYLHKVLDAAAKYDISDIVFSFNINL